MADSTAWVSLKDNTLQILKDSVTDLVDVDGAEVKEALQELAEEAAKQTWLLVNGSDAEKSQAVGNLRSLKAQAIIVAADVMINASREARAAFVKVVETVGIFLLRNAPKLIAAL